jgi:hypothetical protein
MHAPMPAAWFRSTLEHMAAAAFRPFCDANGTRWLYHNRRSHGETFCALLRNPNKRDRSEIQTIENAGKGRKALARRPLGQRLGFSGKWNKSQKTRQRLPSAGSLYATMRHCLLFDPKYENESPGATMRKVPRVKKGWCHGSRSLLRRTSTHPASLPALHRSQGR